MAKPQNTDLPALRIIPHSDKIHTLLHHTSDQQDSHQSLNIKKRETSKMADFKKDQERDELHRAIWAIADELRGAEIEVRHKQVILPR